jgi:hypothetical protein
MLYNQYQHFLIKRYILNRAIYMNECMRQRLFLIFRKCHGRKGGLVLGFGGFGGEIFGRGWSSLE